MRLSSFDCYRLFCLTGGIDGSGERIVIMASYRQALEWLADMDDCEWVRSKDHDAHGLMLSVSASMVRDLWNKTDDKLLEDLSRVIRRNNNGLM